MKVLFVTPEIPHNLGGGGTRMYHMLKYLKLNNIKVDLLSYKHGDKFEKENYGKISEFVEKIFSLEVKQNFFKKINNLICLKAYPKYHNFELLLQKILNENIYDIIHVEKFQMAEYFLNIKNLPIIIDLWAACGLDVAFYEVLYENSIYKKFINLLRIPRYYISDIKFYNNFKNFFVVSEEARNYVLTKYKNKNVYVIPNGVEIEKFPQIELNLNHDLIFVGDMSFFQNIDTVKFFVKKIYPEIKKKFSDVKFYVVGRNPTKDILKIAKRDTSVIVTDQVENIYEYTKKCCIFVAPIRTGSGIRNKILEAMAYGLIVITTKNALEGIEANDNKEVLVANTPTEFVEKIIDVFTNFQKFKIIGQNARKLIENKYQWSFIVSKMISYYEKMIDKYKIKKN
jgi:glycosyltransferase involved in cell wall biosynthesis